MMFRRTLVAFSAAAVLFVSPIANASVSMGNLRDHDNGQETHSFLTLVQEVFADVQASIQEALNRTPVKARKAPAPAPSHRSSPSSSTRR